MNKYKRVFLVLAVLLSGVAIFPAWATPWPDFKWQRFADAYRDPTSTPTPKPIGLLPDLVVSEMRIETATVSFPCVIKREPLGVRVTVANVGKADAGPFIVDSNGTLKAIEGLARGESREIWFKGYINGNPNTAVVDVKNQVRESDETNNRSTQMLPIPTPAPICTGTPYKKSPVKTSVPAVD